MSPDAARALLKALDILAIGLHNKPRLYQEDFNTALAVLHKELGADNEPRIYPCDDCGKMRTKSEGGTTFTVCDECWEKNRDRKT